MMTQETDLQRAQDILSVVASQRNQALNVIAEVQAELAAALRKLEKHEQKPPDPPRSEK